MEVQPASLEQVRRARNGSWVRVDGDVARALQEIDPCLHLRYSESGGHFVVFGREIEADGRPKEWIVTTAQECDMRIVARVLAISDERYDLVAELDRLDGEADRAHDYKLGQEAGAAAERLHHAIRRDLGATDRAFIKGD